MLPGVHNGMCSPPSLTTCWHICGHSWRGSHGSHCRCGVGAARQCHHASGRTAFLNLASLPVPFLSAVHICMDTHMLPAGEATAKGKCPHSIQHLQYLPGVIRPLLLWCAHQPPVLSDSGPEGLCCRMPVDAPTDSDQDKTSTAPPPLLSVGPV